MYWGWTSKLYSGEDLNRYGLEYLTLSTANKPGVGSDDGVEDT